jgi:phosphate transport system permease protein
VAASALAGLSFVWVLFYQLTLLSGALGYLICSYIAFLVIYWAASSLVEGRLLAKDRVITVVMWTAATVVLVTLLIVVYFVVSHGWRTLRWHFFVTDDRNSGPLSPVGSAGGLHAIVGTVEQNGLAMLMGVPLAVLTAIFLNEVGGRFTKSVRTVVTAMSGVPSIVAGLFIYTIWILQFHYHFSGFAAAMALTILLLPTVTRTTEEVLKLVPGGLREASLALGAPEWRTAWSVVLPTARSGVITGVLLGVAVTVGETAPLLFTAFGSASTNLDPLHGVQAALPLVAYTQLQEPIKSQIALGYTTELVLLLLVLILFVLARIVGRNKKSKSRLLAQLWSLTSRRKVTP